MAGRHDFTCDQGATFEREIILKDSTSTIIDITGSTAEMDVRQRVDSTTTLIELSTANGRITIDGSNGKISLLISSSDTTDLITNGVYDLKLTYVSGTVERILEGEFTVDPQVTRT
jgi:hypothetical protein